MTEFDYFIELLEIEEKRRGVISDSFKGIVLPIPDFVSFGSILRIAKLAKIRFNEEKQNEIDEEMEATK